MCLTAFLNVLNHILPLNYMHLDEVVTQHVCYAASVTTKHICDNKLMKGEGLSWLMGLDRLIPLF